MHRPSSNSKRKSARYLIIGGLFVLFIAVWIMYPQAKKVWTAPLGPALDLPTLTSTLSLPTTTPVTPTLVAMIENTDIASTPTETVSPTPTLKPTSTPAPLCGGPPLTTFLAVGADNRDNTYLYGLGDVIRIVRVDFVTPKITVLSIPRDLWVEIPNISHFYNITHGKLNQAYLYGGPGMGYYDGPGGGPGLLARTLDLNFGLRVDHYGAVNMWTFVKIVDAVGGLDIYLPTDVDGTPIDDKTEDMGYFTAGQHHFTGSEALRFARIRKRYNDFTRMDHQNMVICALRAKLLSPSVIPKIPQIIASFQDSVLTDLSPEQISQLACLLPKVERENLLFASLPEEILEPGRVFSQALKGDTFIFNADFAEIQYYVDMFMAGDWPSEPDEPTCP
jgi:polyisoprenyl-teichoic acid--peptidoglycan teichoic acid transferase